MRLILFISSKTNKRKLGRQLQSRNFLTVDQKKGYDNEQEGKARRIRIGRETKERQRGNRLILSIKNDIFGEK